MARQSQEVTLILPINRNNKNAFLFDSESLSPLDNWKKAVPRGTHIKLISDDFLNSKVLELFAPSTSLQSSCFIQYPAAGCKFGSEAESSFLVLILRNFGRAFLIDIIIQDTYNSNYRIRTDTGVGHPILKSFSCLLPLKLEAGWNHLPLDLRELSSKIFNVNYKKTMKIRLHANCLLFKAYFTNEKPSSDKIDLK